eukprot:scpid81778/ scgid33448/ Ras-related protein Rab-15
MDSSNSTSVREKNELPYPVVASAWDTSQTDSECVGTAHIVVVGDLGVGKTSILLRFMENRFISDHEPTIGVDFREKVVECDAVAVNVVLVDTAGQERYHALTKSFYRSASGVMLVFDQSCEESFSHIPDWLQRTREASFVADLPCLLIGNKADLPDEQRVISHERAEKLAKTLGLSYVETSAATGDGIVPSILWLVRDVLRSMPTGDGLDDVDTKLLAGMPTRGKPKRPDNQYSWRTCSC